MGRNDNDGRNVISASAVFSFVFLHVLLIIIIGFHNY